MTALSDIISYIMGNHSALGFSPHRRKWVAQLRRRSEDLKRSLAEGTIRSLLNGTQRATGDEVLKKLADIFKKKPGPKFAANGEVLKNEFNFEDYEPFKNLSILQLRCNCLDDFKNWEKREREGIETGWQARLKEATQAGRIHRSYEFVAKTYPDTPLARFEMIVPSPRRVPCMRDCEELHYVTWRYAIESGGAKRPTIAREVLTFTRVGEMYHSAMSYKLGGYDLHKAVRLFEGPVAFLGRTHMCAMVAVEETSEGWEADYYRGRVLFLRRRNPHATSEARLGLMATTRASGDFEPLAACVTMMRAEGHIEDIQEFRRLITLTRSANEILENDFGSLPHDDLELIKSFLDNRPAHYRQSTSDGSLEGGGDELHDMVLRLHLDRFNENMPRIRKCLLDKKNGSKNPIIKNWKSSGVLLAREDEII
jgi:hypothetical protein